VLSVSIVAVAGLIDSVIEAEVKLCS
jgi:hypothetical protein